MLTIYSSTNPNIALVSMSGEPFIYETETSLSFMVCEPETKVSYDAVHIDIPNFHDKRYKFIKSIIAHSIAKDIDEVTLYKKAGISKQVFSKIRSMGQNLYIPSKHTVVCLCLALELTLEEAQELLAIIGYTLSEALVYDQKVIWCLENRIYDIDIIDE